MEQETQAWMQTQNLKVGASSDPKSPYAKQFDKWREVYQKSIFERQQDIQNQVQRIKQEISLDEQKFQYLYQQIPKTPLTVNSMEVINQANSIYEKMKQHLFEKLPGIGEKVSYDKLSQPAKNEVDNILAGYRRDADNLKPIISENSNTQNNETRTEDPRDFDDDDLKYDYKWSN